MKLKPAKTAAVEESQLLVFSLQKEELGINIEWVREVLPQKEIHPLPKAPDFIEGVINLRGHIIAVIDLRKKFKLSVLEENANKRVIICKIKDFIAGLIVDSVSEVLTLPEIHINPTPKIVSIQTVEGYIKGIARIGERVIVILDLEKILSEEETQKMSQIK